MSQKEPVPRLVYALDYETHYDKEYSLKKIPTWTYCQDPRFNAYMLTMACSDGSEWVGRPEDFDWSRIKGQTILHHNAQFDLCVTMRLVELGKLPRAALEHGACHDTADLAAYMGHPRALKHYAEVIWGLKDIATKGAAARAKMMMEENDADLFKDPEILEYAMNDSRLCLRLWKEESDNWPESERELSRLNREACFRGVPIDEEYVQRCIEIVERKIWQAELDIPWTWPEGKTPLARRQIINECKKLEIWWPASFAKDSVECAKWEDEFSGTYDWIRALRDWRKLHGLEQNFKHLRDNTFDGIFHYQMKYFGAGRTGRFSGDGRFNMLNMGRSETLCDIGEDGRPIKGTGVYLRRCFVGNLGIIDYAQAEPRILLGLVKDKNTLDKVRAGQSVYQAHAERTMGRTWGDMKKEDLALYQAKKMELLLLGYQGGAKKLAGAAYEMTKDSWDPEGVVKWTEDEAAEVVYNYRRNSPLVVRFWHVMQQRILRAVNLNEDCLKLRLPSGRELKYWAPRSIVSAKTGKREICAAVTRGVSGSYRKLYGGLAVENCIAAGTLVLTDSGWKPIENVSKNDKVHDGVDFVAHGGSINKSVQPCVEVDGVYMTPDHEVLTDEGWKTALEEPRPYRPEIRDAYSPAPAGERREKDEVGVRMRMRGASCEGWYGSNEGRSEIFERREGHTAELRVPACHLPVGKSQHARDEQTPGVRGMAEPVRPMPTAHPSVLEELWWAGDLCMRKMAGILRELLGRHGAFIRSWFGYRQDKQRRELHSRELSLDHKNSEFQEQTRLRNSRVGTRQGYRKWHRSLYTVLSCSRWLDSGRRVYGYTGCKKQVCDILNCGPRQRFVVLGDNGPFIVHNCSQAICRDLLRDAWIALDKAGYIAYWTVYDEFVLAMQPGQSIEEASEIIINASPWADFMPIGVEGELTTHYKK